jgi:Mn2+/Fe2+ NRAMP family transporter
MERVQPASADDAQTSSDPPSDRPADGPHPTARRRTRLLAVIGPGVLVAATGVGAGDLATAGLTGAHLGLAVAWAALLGAAAKFVLNENLARHQLATGQTILDSAIAHLGWPVYAPFAVYLVAWSFFVGAALLSANAAVLGALAPTLFDPLGVSASPPPWLLAAACSLIAASLALRGGFALFERIMATCIAVMVTIVIAAAVLTRPDIGDLLRGMLVPNVDVITPGAVGWTIALTGGVGGTLTILCYAYWMREAGRTTPHDLGACRVDLALGYTMTAAFAVAMIVIAAPIEPGDQRGSAFVIQLADALGGTFAQSYGPSVGRAASVVFLIGAFGAVFSSLLGVWQAVPFVAADAWRMRNRVGRRSEREPRSSSTSSPPPPITARNRDYRVYLAGLATVPLLAVGVNFGSIQKAYAVFGAAFVPGLALVLLILNNRTALVGAALRNRWLSNAVLLASLAIALLAAGWDIGRRLGAW